MKYIRKNKFLIIMILFIALVMLLPNKSNAMWEEVFEDGDKFLESADSDSVKTIDEEKLQEVSSVLYNTLYYGGMAISGVIATYLGIKIAFASAVEKAKVKETLLPYVIGCIIIFASLSIWKIAVDIIPNDAKSKITNNATKISYQIETINEVG